MYLSMIGKVREVQNVQSYLSLNLFRYIQSHTKNFNVGKECRKVSV